jgi:hypothetical protein
MNTRISGYDPATKVCWRFENKGDRELLRDHRKTCPVCSLPSGQRDLMLFGRCRSGQRWLWVARNFAIELWDRTAAREHGFTATEDEAWEAMQAAVVRLAAGRPAMATVSHGNASAKLSELAAAKRYAKPPPDTSGAGAVEYLYCTRTTPAAAKCRSSVSATR